MIVEIYGHEYLLMPDQQLRKNFKLNELANNKGDILKPQFIIDADVDLFLDMLQEFRDWFNKPMKITSGFRQKSYNLKVGGDPKSAHTHACAVDWWIPGHTEQQRVNVKNKWNEICVKHKVIGSINYYSNGYHLEAFSDKWYGQKIFKIREYRNTNSDW